MSNVNVLDVKLKETNRRVPGDYAFTFEPTNDEDLIKSMVTHVKIYPSVVDDHAPSRAEYQPPMHPSLLYLVVRDHDELQGLFFFHPINAVTFEVHTCLLPHSWGGRARAIAREMLKWLWANTDAHRLITSVPDYNRLALVFAKAAGMKEYGRNPESFMKDGKLRDLILLGIGRPKEIKCP